MAEPQESFWSLDEVTGVSVWASDWIADCYVGARACEGDRGVGLRHLSPDARRTVPRDRTDRQRGARLTPRGRASALPAGEAGRRDVYAQSGAEGYLEKLAGTLHLQGAGRIFPA